MSALELFHFMRPLFLLVLPVILVAWWGVRRHGPERGQMTGFVARHLREALTVNREARTGFRPVDGVAISMLAATIAAAGPAWSKQPSPWFSETAPLVIAFEVSDSMRSNDLQPTRLDRARFKVLDLIAQRTGSRTALIAYSGSAHVVMPPTTDVDVFKPFLESLDPAIMPEAGAGASAVLPLAQGLLGEASAVATLLFVNDGFDPSDVPALSEFVDQPAAASVAALVVGTDEGGVALLPDGSPAVGPGGGRVDTSVDIDVLRRIETAADVSVVRAGNGDNDIQQLLRVIASNLQQADDPDAQWTDQAWWFLWPAAFFTLFWFRRGWTVQW